jgi:hypothetical protein
MEQSEMHIRVRLAAVINALIKIISFISQASSFILQKRFKIESGNLNLISYQLTGLRSQVNDYRYAAKDASMKQFLLLLSLALAGLSARGQQPTFQERAYRLDSKFKFMCTSDTDRQGNVILSGLIRPGTPDLHNSMILLVKPNTDTLWTRRGPDVPDFGIYPGVKFRTNGGYAFATTIKKTVPQPDLYDGVLQKYSSFGILLLNHIFTVAGNDNGINNFITLPDKGYLFNTVERAGAVFDNLILTRTDSAGNVLWQRNHSNVAANGLAYMEHAGNGGAILAGSFPNSGTGAQPYKVKLLLTDSNGNALNSNTLNLTNDPGRSEAMYDPATSQCVVRLSDGNFLITGIADTTNSQAGVYGTLGFVVKLNTNLQVVWKYIHRPPSMTAWVDFTKAKELKDGSIIVLGQTTQANSFGLYRLSSTGKLVTTNSLHQQLIPNSLPEHDGSPARQQLHYWRYVPHDRERSDWLLHCQSKDSGLAGRPSYLHHGYGR